MINPIGNIANIALQFAFSFVAAGLACLTSAHADSKVKLWGRVGGDIMYIDNIKTANKSQSRLSEGSNYGASVFGINTTEDLGGSTAVMVALEGRFNPGSGTLMGQKLWGRAAYVALRNDTYGSIKFGQQKIINNFTYRFDPLAAQNFSSGTFVNSRNNAKFANTIRYDSPSFNGFEFSGSLSLGQGLDGFRTGPADPIVKNGTAWGVSAGLVKPTWEIRVLYDQVNNQNGQLDNLFISSSEIFLGIKKQFGPILIQAAFSRYWAPNTAPGLSKTAGFYWGGGTYDISPFLHTSAALYYINTSDGKWTDDHDGGGHATMLALGATYDLSKSTFLYMTAAHVFNSVHANFSVYPTGPGLKGGTDYSPVPGHGQNGVYTGFVTSF
ncbi:porin [Burkholderia cepacia]|uniref:porin n=1 Tax=Burkholderia cepacia TaxID=292 RepID=UPI0009C0A369|nr:porin [Burkholderia cepacia]